MVAECTVIKKLLLIALNRLELCATTNHKAACLEM